MTTYFLKMAHWIHIAFVMVDLMDPSNSGGPNILKIRGKWGAMM